MPRIRTIKPDFWQDEKLSPLEPIARLVFLGLISMADDEGRLLDSPRLIDGFLFPQTEDSAVESLEILARLGRILRYRSDSGQRLIQVVNWQRHQYVREKARNCLPAPGTTLTISDADSDETLTRIDADSDEKIRSMRDFSGSRKLEVGEPTLLASTGEGNSRKRFDDWWERYPKKTGKKDCWAWWERSRPKPELVAQMLDALVWQTTSPRWTRDGGAYRLDPIRWLKRGCWDDDREAYGPWPDTAVTATSQAAPKGILEGVAHLQARRRVGDGPDDWENWYEMVAAEDAEVAF